MIAPNRREIYRGYEVTAFEVRRGFKFLVRENGALVWSSRPIKSGTLDDMIAAGKKWIDEQYPATLGVYGSDSVATADVPR